MHLQGYKGPSISIPEPLNHKQAPSTNNLRSKMKAEQRARRIRSVDILPEEQRQNSQLVINHRNAGINRSYWLFRPWQQSRSNISDVSHVFSSAVIEKDVPSGIIASYRKEDKGKFCCVNENGHDLIGLNRPAN